MQTFPLELLQKWISSKALQGSTALVRVEDIGKKKYQMLRSMEEMMEHLYLLVAFVLLVLLTMKVKTSVHKDTYPKYYSFEYTKKRRVCIFKHIKKGSAYLRFLNNVPNEF